MFDGKTYTSDQGCGNKKEAEQLVALVAIDSLIGVDAGSDSGILLQIINSKNRIHGGNIILDNSINRSNAQRAVAVGVRPSNQPVKALW